jgi:glycine dehydrogenase
MAMCFGINKKRRKFFADKRVHPQTHGLLKTRSTAVGAELVIGDASALTPEELEQYAGVIVQYPDTLGSATTHADLADACHEAKALLVAAVDPMALAMLTPPGEWGADIVVGSAQRFGVPMGFGGPHAGFLATNQSYARRMPGRLIGVSVDAEGAPALRMAMQTREQHIRRDKATSNICTAQALLANMAAAYGIYHGPEGLKEIAGTCHAFACTAAAALRDHGFEVPTETYFDTITVNVGKSGMKASDVAAAAAALDVNVRVVDEATVGLAFGEGTTSADLSTLLQAFGVSLSQAEVEDLALEAPSPVAGDIERSTPILTHPVFSKHQSESQMMRYLRCLEAKDLGLNHSMISLGSCTMKLNATAEMMPITWPEFADIHPFAPVDQTTGCVERALLLLLLLLLLPRPRATTPPALLLPLLLPLLLHYSPPTHPAPPPSGTSSSSTRSTRTSPSSRASLPSLRSPTPAPRASTPASWPSRSTTRPTATRSATCASSRSPRTAPTPPRPPWPA